MNYPERYFSRMFAWGRPLELARRFAIYSGILLFLIACAAAAVIWARRSESARPYFLHVSGGDWAVYSESAQKSKTELSWALLMQESIAARYAELYFRIPDGQAEADNLWCGCQDCGEWNKCGLCCGADPRAFDSFKEQILPKWRAKFEAGETQRLINVVAETFGRPGDRGGVWKITGALTSGKNKPREIIGFMKIDQSKNLYPLTLGFYVAEFYWYEDK